MLELKLSICGIYKKILFFYCVLLACRDLLQSMGAPVFFFLALLFIIPFALLLWEFLRDQRFSLATFFFFLIVSFYIFIYPININGLQFFLPLFCAGIAFRHIEYRYLAKCFLITQIVCLVLRIYFINVGLITEKELGAYWKVSDGRSVFDFGYGNANTAGMVFFFLCSMIYCNWFERKKLISFCLILIISIVAYYYTASRTSFFSSLLLLITYLVPVKCYAILRKKIILFFVPLMVAAPLIMIVFSSNISYLDQFLTGRIYYIIYMLSHFEDSTSFITGVFIDENDYFPIDNVFSFLLVYGGVVAILVWGVFYMSIIRNSKQIPFYVLALIVVIVFSGIGESSWATFGRLGSSFFWLLLLNKSIVSDRLQTTN